MAHMNGYIVASVLHALLDQIIMKEGLLQIAGMRGTRDQILASIRQGRIKMFDFIMQQLPNGYKLEVIKSPMKGRSGSGSVGSVSV